MDLFDEKRNNILMTRNTIPSWADSGIAFPQVNLGKTKNHGLELDVTWNDRIGKFNYYAKFSLPHKPISIPIFCLIDSSQVASGSASFPSLYKGPQLLV